MATLDPDFISRAKTLLVPHVQDPAERNALLVEAFQLRNSVLRYEIELAGSASAFAVNCLGKLLDKGCDSPGLHNVSVLLGVLALGAEHVAERERLQAMANALCADGEKHTKPQTPPDELQLLTSAAPAGDRSQVHTVHTAFDRRTPTVFIAHAHQDREIALELVRALQAAQHACWLDDMSLELGDDWVRAISEGINNSYGFVVLCSNTALESPWVRNEILWAIQKKKQIVPVLLEDVAHHDRFLPLAGFQAVTLDAARVAGYAQVVRALPRVRLVEPLSAGEAPTRPRATPRSYELEYLDRLRLEELIEAENYTPLAGQTVQREKRAVRDHRGVIARQEFEHLAWRAARENPASKPPRRFENAVDELLSIRRAAVLGEPGAGKSTVLWIVARRLFERAMKDPAAPIPLLIRLGRWTRANQALDAFIASELGVLGEYLPTLIRTKRAAFLLDGLNEIPVEQRDEKAMQVRDLVHTHRDALALITCREQDYTTELELDRVAILPLVPERILQFAQRQLADEARGEVLFWKMVGGDLKPVWQKWRKAGASFGLFFSATEVPSEAPNVYAETLAADNRAWREHVRNERGLIKLAANPYMLVMMCRIYEQLGDLPANRGALFAEFTKILLLRERLATGRDHAVHPTEEGEALLAALGELAFALQHMAASDAQSAGRAEGARTVMPMAQARTFLSDTQLYRATSANLLLPGREVRFAHQLLQEYFAARELDQQRLAGRITPDALWPRARWWQRSGWEETAILLAGLYSDDCSDIARWVAQANPEAAALCITRSGAHTPDESLLRFRADWVPRLADLKTDPAPEARAAVGRALGLLRLKNGELLDDRPGVGVRAGTELPDIDWADIPGGNFVFGERDTRTRSAPFRIARYPITYAQFQCFIDAGSTGWANPRWWQGLSADQGHRISPGEQKFKYLNHPREGVSWYDAVAFCRWLSSVLGYAITLPTELQWERAARHTDGRLYPWGGKQYKSGYANIDEHYQHVGPHYLQRTSAVGIYPQGASIEGVSDLVGNIWEWCLNEYGALEHIQLEGRATRALRGGSWYGILDHARAVARFNLNPNDRLNGIGFRVVCAPV